MYNHSGFTWSDFISVIQNCLKMCVEHYRNLSIIISLSAKSAFTVNGSCRDILALDYALRILSFCRNILFWTTIKSSFYPNSKEKCHICQKELKPLFYDLLWAERRLNKQKMDQKMFLKTHFCVYTI